MPLERGTRLGPYQIESPLGAGGMGEVYKATDTRLERTVAIKVLPAHVASDPERKSRFEREAKVISGLNHPHICTLYEFDNHEGTDFLVMEYLEGETLADRLGKGALPLDQALRYAIEIADALDKAHRQGVTHRDLKPANIMLTKAGAKLLDFGLAKLKRSNVKADLATLAATRTQEQPLTEKGTVLGTVQYMAPEQLEGKDADHRSDIFAFGAIVYEMVTGQRAFEGKSQLSLITAILEHDPPPISVAQETSPPALDHVVRTCLAKDPDNRWEAAGDIARQLSWVGEGSSQAAGAPTARPALWQRPVSVAAIALGTAVVASLAAWSLTRPVPAPITRLSIILPQTQVRTNTGRRGVAISPTGTHVVYVANSQLYLRALDELQAQPLTGTEESFPSIPFFSPDGQWIGFYSVQERALKKVAISGGAAVTLTEASNPYGASWGADDTILFGQGSQGILRVAGAGGTPDVLVAVEPPNAASHPQMLPGGGAVLYTLGRPTNVGQWDTAQIVVEQVATGERTVVIDGGSDARYLPTGHLVYALGSTLLAVPFDVDRLEVTGGPVPLVEGVSRAASTGAANVDMARTGALVYLPGEGAGGDVRTPVWVDRNGNEEALGIPPRSYTYARISPDGTRMTLDARDDEDDVWVWDLTRETLTRLTFAAEPDHSGVWTPDARRIVFSSERDGAESLYWRAADGTGVVERLTETTNEHDPTSVSPDGGLLLFSENATGDNDDLYTLTLDDDRRIEPLIVTEFNEANGEVSPDGRWLAYESDASGQLEIYVQPFPDVDTGRWQISTMGGRRPLWGPDGQELFYLTAGGLMSLSVITDPAFSAGTPQLLIQGAYYGTVGGFTGRTYDISPDGQRFLMLKEGASLNADDPFAGLTQIHVVQNWFEELRARVPTP